MKKAEEGYITSNRMIKGYKTRKLPYTYKMLQSIILFETEIEDP